jgi:formate dehydrogenase subunit beta
MTVFASLPIKDKDALASIRDLLAKLLEKKIVDGVLVPVEHHDGSVPHPALVTDASQTALANPLVPMMLINAARMVKLLLTRPEEDKAGEEPERRLAVVMRPCELRALIELAKLQQVDPAQILTVGIDCVGTYELDDFKAVQKKEEAEATLAMALQAAQEGKAEAPGETGYRHACSICVTPVAWNADISLHTIGVDSGSELLVELADEAMVEKLELGAEADPAPHQQAVETLISTREARRKEDLDAFAEIMKADEQDAPGLIAAFQDCQRCHNCTVVCPVCYCKECLFRTDTVTYEPERYFGWAQRKGAARLPGDTVAFQLTRLSHVSTACVGCGMCTSGCPSRLPVDTLFQVVARETQGLLEYVPGRDLEEKPPRTTFRQDEFVKLGREDH